MHIVLRLIVTLLASVLGSVLGFGAVALIFLVLHLDAGIGGGLIALLVGIIGGVATQWGPAIGALIMVGIQELFRTAIFGLAPKWVSQGHAMAFGLLVGFTILFMSNGVVGDWVKIKRLLVRGSSEGAS